MAWTERPSGDEKAIVSRAAGSARIAAVAFVCGFGEPNDFRIQTGRWSGHASKSYAPTASWT
jgi:hypothetical protein